jgi:hypothetical protein
MSKRFEQTGGREAVVDRMPTCDLCRGGGRPTEPAFYDGKTTQGPWAFMCERHFREYGVGLGEGRGQKLFTEDIDDKEEHHGS